MKTLPPHTAARRITATSVVAVCAFLVAAHAASAQCQYEVTAIIQGPGCAPSGSPTVLIGIGMNDLGHVTGYFHDCFQGGFHHGFFWTPETGRVSMHKPPDVWRVQPTAINDNGLIVGSMQITGVGQRSFVYDRHTQQYLALLEPLHGAGGSSMNAINNAGIAVGSRSIGKPGQNPNPYNAVIWNTNTGAVIDLGVMNGPNSWATDITEAGDVIGSMGSQLPNSGWVRMNGRVTVLGPVPNGTTSSAFAINAAGALAVGGWLKQNREGILTQGAIWKNGEWQMLPLLDGANSGGPTEINDLGQSGGSVGFPPNPSSDQTAVLWQHGNAHEIRDLVLDIPDNMSIWTVRGMNNAGQILTRAIDGGNVAVVLSPIDRPFTDLNADCVTDVHDLLMLLDAWSEAPVRGATASPADFNGDGVIDVSDLLILLANWSH